MEEDELDYEDGEEEDVENDELDYEEGENEENDDDIEGGRDLLGNKEFMMKLITTKMSLVPSRTTVRRAHQFRREGMQAR